MFDEFLESPSSPLVVVAERRFRRRPPYNPGRVVRLLGLTGKGLVLALGVYGAWELGHSEPTPKDEDPPPSKKVVVVPSPIVPTADETKVRDAIALAEKDGVAIRREKLSETFRLVGETNSACDRLDRALKVWNENVLVLLENEAGRNLAARRELLPVLGPLFDTSVPTTEETASMRRSVAMLTQSFLEAWESKNYFYQASEELVGSLTSIASKANLRSIEIETVTNKVLDLLSVSEARGKKGPHSLRRAMALHRQATADEMVRAEAEAKERERLAGVSYRAQQTAAFERAQQAIQNRQQEAEQQTALISAHARLHVARAEQDRQKRIAYAKSPDVQKYLLPFITPGYEQLDGTYTAQPRPYSWQKLQSSGALVDGRGFDIMLQLVSSPNDKDRPRWFPNGTYDGAHHHRDQIREAQRLLGELGPTLVEAGMLDP